MPRAFPSPQQKVQPQGLGASKFEGWCFSYLTEQHWHLFCQRLSSVCPLLCLVTLVQETGCPKSAQRSFANAQRHSLLSFAPQYRWPLYLGLQPLQAHPHPPLQCNPFSVSITLTYLFPGSCVTVAFPWDSWHTRVSLLPCISGLAARLSSCGILDRITDGRERMGSEICSENPLALMHPALEKIGVQMGGGSSGLKIPFSPCISWAVGKG